MFAVSRIFFHHNFTIFMWCEVRDAAWGKSSNSFELYSSKWMSHYTCNYCLLVLYDSNEFLNTSHFHIIGTFRCVYMPFNFTLYFNVHSFESEKIIIFFLCVESEWVWKWERWRGKGKVNCFKLFHAFRCTKVLFNLVILDSLNVSMPLHAHVLVCVYFYEEE
jgi:hypothetical protein